MMVQSARQARRDTMATAETHGFAARRTLGLLDDLAMQIKRTRRSPSPDAVHQVRIALRRFSQSLSAFRTLFVGAGVGKIRRKLRTLMNLAGAVRDRDVALKFIQKWRGPAEIVAALQLQRNESAQELVSKLSRWTGRRLHETWRATLEESFGSTGPAEATIHEVADQALRRIVKRLFKKGSQAASRSASAYELHRFRIAVKRFRYTLELFEPLYGSSLTRPEADAKRLSVLLGDIHDCVAVADLLPHDPSAGHLARRLKKRRRKKTREFRRTWKVEFAERDPRAGLHVL